MSVQTFGLVSNWVFCFLVVEILKNYILDISALSDMCFTIIVSYSVIGIFALLNLFFFFLQSKVAFLKNCNEARPILFSLGP